jgi:nucleotide-binding universal stress UspA family protein
MINTLISLNADLASSIAFRYACRLTEFIGMRLQTIHVEEVENDGYPPGSGWVRSTWEEGLLRTAKEEISQLINAEKASCPPLDDTIIRIGDRDDELLQEIKRRPYDLLLEGVLSSFDAQLFHKRVRTRLYKYAPCPIILVKNLVAPDRVALLLGDLKEVTPLVSAFVKIYANAKATVDLVYFSIKKTDQAEFKTKLSDAAMPGLEDAGHVIVEAKARLAKHGWTPAESWIVRDRPQKIGEMLEDYGLVGSCVPRSTNKKNLVLELLSRVPSATLLVR